MTLKEQIARYLAYLELATAENQHPEIDEYHFDRSADIINDFITHATQRLIDEGFEPGGKAIKAIEGMKDE